MFDTSRELLVRGIAAAKAGDKEEARFYLEKVLQADGASQDNRCDAWYWLSEISEKPEEQRAYLEEILARNLGDARARRKLAILDGKLKPDDIIDPDSAKQVSGGGLKGVQGVNFDCPKCGGRMVFAPDGQSLVCEYCQTAERLEQNSRSGLSLEEENFIAALATSKGHFKPVAMRLFICQGCGCKLIMPPRRMTLTCPYCMSAHVVAQAEEEQIVTPHSLIPFKVDEQRARLALSGWFKENGFTRRPRVERGFALYFPLWTFDVGGQIDWKCLVQVSEGRRRQWKPLSGTKAIYVDDVKILATNRLPEKFAALVEDYDLHDLVVYDPRYLSSFVAESYQISLGDASLQARSVALEGVRKQIILSFTQPMRDLILKTAGMVVQSFRLVLLPAWLTRYTWGDTSYRALINGQNGRVYAEQPRRGFLG